MNLFYQPGIPRGVSYLDADESRHCVKVLRKRWGDVITITDGAGFFYEALVTIADPARCAFDVQKKTPAPEKDFFIHVAVSPTKNSDRIEWFVEKATEIGIDRITLMDCENTERSFIKTERLIKVAVTAMKQSLKAVLPTISDDLLPFSEVLTHCHEDHMYIAAVDLTNPVLLKDSAKKGASYRVLIGPEGDFSPEELAAALDHKFRKVSLGPSRLRTETAAIAACHILNLVNE